MGFPASELVERASSLLSRQGAGIPCPVTLPGLSDGRFPATGAVPTAQVETLRRQAYELIEGLLSLVSPKEAADNAAAPVPLLRTPAPVPAGASTMIRMQVANEGTSAVTVALYCSNLVGDSGMDIPALRISLSPPVLTIAAKAQGEFVLQIAVPPQIRPGVYSGVVQASGLRDVRAVVAVDVM